MMAPAQVCLLLGASAAAGAINAVAGGGSFLTFPALVFCGLPASAANQTSSVALWPGALASVWAYRKEMSARGRLALILSAISMIGGLVGAMILLHTPSVMFDRLVPWLTLSATLLFAFGKKTLTRFSLTLGEAASGNALFKAASIQFFIAIYGGFYGAGAGILMLAVLELLDLGNIHAMNAFKMLLNACFNGVAVVAFIMGGAVAWPQALLMMAGGIAGGYGGAWIAQKMPANWIRGFVIAVGAAMTVYFFQRLR
jgi:uncharacterized membrane protein YfcA